VRYTRRMRFIAAFASSLGLALAVFACAADATDDSAPEGDEVDTGNEQDITKAKSQLQGSWTIADESKDDTSTVAYELRPGGELWRDDNRILNGVMVKDAPRPVTRSSGTYTINTSKHTLTLHLKNPIKTTEVLTFDYKPGRILNGVFKPGSEPDTRATLTLTREPKPNERTRAPSYVFKHADSWCTADQDCKDEAKDKTWLEGTGAPSVTCDKTNRICLAAVNGGVNPNKCGNTTCAAGMVCCNPLMNICTKPGEFCIQ
jgi:hypothetical protein